MFPQGNPADVGVSVYRKSAGDLVAGESAAKGAQFEPVAAATCRFNASLAAMVSYTVVLQIS